VSSLARHPVCATAELPPGARVICEIAGRSVGVFNVEGNYYALHNRCPHRGGALCEGPLTGTTLPSATFEHRYGLEGRIIRCAWHGWEFDVQSGRCLVDERVRARSFPVEIDDGQIFVLMPARERATTRG
jgi:nitrite reductase (NADH) small subunit